MSCHVRGNSVVRKAKLYFSVKDVFFSCQQARLHHRLLDSPCSQFPLHSHSLSLPLCLLSLALQRTDWEYYFTWTEFFCHAVIAKVLSRVQDKSKHFFYCYNALSLSPTVLHSPPLSQPLLSHLLFPISSGGLALCWTLTSDSLPQAVPSSGRDLNLMCISLQDG